MENIIQKEIDELINKLARIISKNCNDKDDLTVANYYLNCIFGLFLATNSKTTAVVKEEKPKVKRKYTKRKYKNEEVMQVLDKENV